MGPPLVLKSVFQVAFLVLASITHFGFCIPENKFYSGQFGSATHVRSVTTPDVSLKNIGSELASSDAVNFGSRIPKPSTNTPEDRRQLIPRYQNRSQLGIQKIYVRPKGPVDQIYVYGNSNSNFVLFNGRIISKEEYHRKVNDTVYSLVTTRIETTVKKRANNIVNIAANRHEIKHPQITYNFPARPWQDKNSNYIKPIRTQHSRVTEVLPQEVKLSEGRHSISSPFLNQGNFFKNQDFLFTDIDEKSKGGINLNGKMGKGNKYSVKPPHNENEYLYEATGFRPAEEVFKFHEDQSSGFTESPSSQDFFKGSIVHKLYENARNTQQNAHPHEQDNHLNSYPGHLINLHNLRTDRGLHPFYGPEVNGGIITTTAKYEGDFANQNENDRYRVSSPQKDGISDQIHNREENSIEDTVTGFYSYTDGYLKQTVHYKADRILDEQNIPLNAGGPNGNPQGELETQTTVAGYPVHYRVIYRLQSLPKKQSVTVHL